MKKGDVGKAKPFSKKYGKGDNPLTTCKLNKSFVKMPVSA